MQTDILIIGGGASGLAAAVAAKMKNPKLSVTICERNDRVGKKLLATGNGRCNLSNRSSDKRFFHGSVDAAGLIGRTVGAEDFFRELGMLTCADDSGRVYPYSNSAATVLNTLRSALERLGAEEVCGFEVKGYSGRSGCFTVTSADGRSISAKRLIIAAGGYAAPVYGTDGGMLRLLRDRGYKTARIAPAVAPLRVSPESVKGLKGVRAKCCVSAFSGGKWLGSEDGEIQFTENSLSGICVFNLAYLFADHQDDLVLRVNFAPDLDRTYLIGYFQGAAAFCKEAGELAAGIFSRNLAAFLVKKALGVPLNEPAEKLGRDAPERLADTVQDCRFRITGSAPWQNAQSTLGGVSASEITPELSSRKEPGVYLCGEILDCAGDCGGFNLKWAWASGITAGENCADSLKGGKR